MPNPVTRWQIVSPKSDALADFYCRLFDWESHRDNLLRFNAIDTGTEKGIPGGVWPAPPEAPSFVQLFIEVDDCATCVAKAYEMGATVLIPPQVLPDGDTISILKDPFGVSFGVVRPAAG